MTRVGAERCPAWEADHAPANSGARVSNASSRRADGGRSSPILPERTTGTKEMWNNSKPPVRGNFAAIQCDSHPRWLSWAWVTQDLKPVTEACETPAATA
jgi:hypothetical protein